MMGPTKHLYGGGVSTVAPELPHVDASTIECRELLERVVNSRELNRAQRLRELLCYLGKRSQKPHAGVLREQEIGAAVFGRPGEYDTSLDNIVRVNVSELRKRLAHYFLEEGANEPIVMEIPRGGYVPVFYARNAPVKDPVPEPVVAKSPADPEIGVVPSAAAIVPVSEASAAADVVAAPRRGATIVGALALGLGLALVACAALVWQNYSLRAQIRPWGTEPVRAAFWDDFFASGEEVDIVTADTSFALAQDLLGRTISLNDYLDYNYKNFADDPSLSPDKRAALRLVLDRNNGSIGDFQAAERLMDLDAHSQAVKLAGARSYTPESIKANNVILIGSRESNPWVELYTSRMNFILEYDPAAQRSYIVNRVPQPGEKAVYEASVDRSQGYSVVCFLPNLSERRYTLILSGSDSQATRAAGEFVASSEGLAQIRQKMPQGSFPYFEVLLGSSRLVGTTLNTEILAYRVHARQSGR
jgi:hypothetical protein